MKQLVLVCDEGYRIFDRSKENTAAGIPNIDVFTAQSRHAKIGLIVASQEVVKLTNSLLSNTSLKIVFSLASGRDEWEVGISIGLDQRQKEFLKTMKTGQAIVSRRGQKPFVVQFPFSNMIGSLTDEEVKTHSEPILQKLRERVIPRSNLFLQRLKKDREESTPDQEAMVYLTDIARTQDLTVMERNQTLNMSNYTEKRLRKNLLIRGLIREVKVNNGKKGGQPVLLQLTTAGRNLLKDAGISIKHECRGGVKHIYWQKRIKEFFKSAGYSVELEGRGANGNVDVLVISSNGKRIAVEVALSPEYELRNIEKSIRSNFNGIIVASENLKIQERIRKQALTACDSEDFKKIRFCLVQDFSG